MNTTTNTITIYSALKAASGKDRQIKSMTPTTQYWLATKQYAEKVLNPMRASGKNNALNQAMGYDTNNEDLIQDAIVKLNTRYKYIVKKYNEINTSPDASDEKTMAELNKILCTVIPSMLTDQWRHISEETEYEVTDASGKSVKKAGKGLKATHSAISIHQNQNASEGSDDEVTLMDCLAESNISIADRAASSDAIMTYVCQLIDSPRQMLGFLAMYAGIPTNEIIHKMSYMTQVDIFNEVLELFAVQFECPALLHLKNYYSEEDLTYTGAMPLYKVLSNDRSCGKKKVMKYILDNHLR